LATSSELWQRRHTEVVEAIEAIDNGGSYVIQTRTFTSADMVELEAMERLYAIYLAISRIEGGAQQYTIGQRRFGRGDLAQLYSERRVARIALARIRQGGIRVRQVIPT